MFPAPMNGTSPSSRHTSMFGSYVALAKGLVHDLTGVSLVDDALNPWGHSGDFGQQPNRSWLRSLEWSDIQERPPATCTGAPGQWWTAVPLERPDGALLGVFCVSQRVATAPARPSRTAADLVRRLRPLLDCIHRDMAAAKPSHSLEQLLTERTDEIEWLFKITGTLKGAADDQHILEQLLAAATQRLSCDFCVLHIPDKRLTVAFTREAASADSLQRAWRETQPHLLAWVQRQHRPLVINRVRSGRSTRVQCKMMCVPVIRESDRVIGMLVFYNRPASPDFLPRHVFLARHIGRQAAALVEAQFDLMTGLYTRSGLDQMYSGLQHAQELVEHSVIYIDIDHVRVANETHGFELGNELIVRVADLLSTPLLPDEAHAGRIAGDRFAVILPQATSGEAVAVAHKLQAAAMRIVIGPAADAFDVSVSCGVSALLPLPDGLSRAIAAAESACKSAKNRGRNRVELYAFEDGSMMRRHQDALAVGQLRSALKSDRLLLYAQRIHPLQDTSLPGGYEILLRLRDLDGSLIAPGPLIDAAQRYQILPSIDRWVARRALQLLAPYRSMLRTRELGMSINVSGQSIADETFIQQLSQLLKEASLPRQCVTVELTEQSAITDLALAADLIRTLDSIGCRIALDDFGTGANSLTYLKALQVYRIKIDGSFVRDVLKDKNSRATIKGIVELAKQMRIETVAEYVETDEIARELCTLGIDYAQGYAFGKPEPLADLLEALTRDESRRQHQLFLRT